MIRDPKKFKDYKMYWGKHKNKSLHTLPSAYLYYLATDSENSLITDDLATMADEEWQWREKMDQHIGVPKHDRHYTG